MLFRSTWMKIPDITIKLLEEIMSQWKTKLIMFNKVEMVESRWIHFRKGLLQGDNLSALAFCMTEIPIGMLMNESKGYIMGKPGERNTNKTHSLFMDDLKLYRENEESLELLHDTIVQASFDTGARYGVKKCAEVVFRKGVMVKGNGLSIMEDRMKSLDPDNGDYYKFLGLEQANGIDRHQVYKNVKEKVKERMQNIVTYELHDKNLINAINTRVIPVITYGMNVIKYTKEELTSLEMIIKICLREKKNEFTSRK